MAIAQNALYQRIKDAFPDAEIELQDFAGDNNHYNATITSRAFLGLSRVQQHKCVFDALSDILEGSNATLHALSLKTKLPDAS